MSAEIIMGVVAVLLMRAKVFYASKFRIVEEGGSGDSIKLHMYLLTYSRIRINDYGFLLKKASSVESKELKKNQIWPWGYSIWIWLCLFSMVIYSNIQGSNSLVQGNIVVVDRLCTF